jgi:hypothetical protein
MWTTAFVIPALISPKASQASDANFTYEFTLTSQPPPAPKHLQSMAIIDIINAEMFQQVIDSLGGKLLVNSLITTVERLAQTTDALSSDARTTLASTTLLAEYLITAVERLTQETGALSSDASATIASTALLVENLIATMNALALNMHYLLQGCIALVALLCLLTVLFIVRWCYAFSRELRGVQHLKTA